MNFSNEGLLQAPFGVLKTEQYSPLYYWDNRQRGPNPFVIIQYTERGEGIFEIKGKRYSVRPGHAFIALVPEDSRYYYPSDAREPWAFAWINFYGDLAIHLWTSLRNQADPVISLQPSGVRLLHRLITRISRKERPEPFETSLAAYEFYLETLRHIPRRQETRTFKEVISHFKAHYHESLRIKEVAQRMGMSREHFTRLFRQQVGCGPATFLKRIRLDAAARLLRTTDLPVGEVTFRCGWPSASRLDFSFKQYYGVSPRDYRRR